MKLVKSLFIIILLMALVACGTDATTDIESVLADETVVAAGESVSEQLEDAGVDVGAIATEVSNVDVEAIGTQAAEVANSEEVQDAVSEVEDMIATGKLNLNTVSGEELLTTIPGFSDRMVREFEEYRPYISIQQFRQEIGKYVDEAQIETYEQYVYVPVDIDESDLETLMQIPGIDEALAQDLMAGRPFESNEAFLDALGEVLTPEQVAAAEAYLTNE